MAYLDIVGPDAEGKFNRRLAKLVGLQTAVYASEILNILFRVRTKKTYDPEGFWTLDRKYVEERTTISPENQRICDEALKLVGILDSEGSNKIRVRVDVLFKILADDTLIPPETIMAIQHKVSTPPLSNKEKRMFGLKKCITETDNDLKIAYENWVEAIDEKRKVTKPVIQGFINDVNNYTTDKNKKLEIIHIATQAGWAVVDWCVRKTKNNLPSSTNLPEQNILW